MLKTQFGTQRISTYISATKRTVRSSVIASAESRPLWMPGTAAPSHLKGMLPGDYGFDPLNLGGRSND